jgi:hypothetical protein
MAWTRTRLVLAAAVTVLVTGCAGASTPPFEPPDLAAMDDYGCGYGFWLGSPDGRAALRFAADHEEAVSGGLPQEASLPHEAWDATVLIGEDLYANWCDDVLEAGEPEPVVAEEWLITAGTLTFDVRPETADCPVEARATATSIEATRPDGTTVELGRRQLTNETWGCFAG